MTESEWWNSTTPNRLADWLFFDTFASDRKLRLFAVACCRRVAPLLRHLAGSVARLMPLAESFADGITPAGPLTEAWADLLRLWRENERLDGQWLSQFEARNRDAPTTAEEEDFVSFLWVSRAVGAAAYALVFTADERDRPDRRYRRRGFYVGPDPRPFPFMAAAEAAEAVATGDAGVAQARESEQRAQVALLRDIFGPLPFRDVPFSPCWRTSTVLALATQMYESRCFDAAPILADALEEAGCDSADILNHLRAGGVHVRGCWAVDLALGKG